ncbi:MAG: AmmeMemoRadiSam system protein A [Candidatus Parcubacteria bacterium]|nr:AmmeMemoRadiSam system protein A [Candidatus Parcubacteria bacterium]
MDSYTKLAKDTIEQYLTSGKILAVPEGLPKEMLLDKAGVFVSLHRQGQLRGCIGTLQATTANIATEIIQNALSAALEDPRFNPLQKQELADLEISVDILNPAALIKNRQELNLKKFGIICQSGYKKGLLLPDIDGVDSIDEQIDIACQKGGIDPLKDKFDIYKFTVTRHE